MITFKDPQERVTFSHKSFFVSRPEREVYTVYIHDAPFELPDNALKLRLQPYGEVLRITTGRFPHCTHVETGIRYVKMHIDNPIPSFIRFGRRLVRTSYQGQQRTCRRCNQPGHQAKECQMKFCFNCERAGHEAPDCTVEILCSICKDSSHLAKNCPCGFLLVKHLLPHNLLSLIYNLLESLFSTCFPTEFVFAVFAIFVLFSVFLFSCVC